MTDTSGGWKELMRQAFDDADLLPDEIPAIDLYMDQIITIFENRLKKNKRRPQDKLLTKTMINNYSKEGLIKPVKGKKYTRGHIIQIMMVYNLKSTLTLQEIKEVLSRVGCELADDSEMESCYRKYLDIKREHRAAMPEILNRMLEGAPLDTGSAGDLLSLLLSLSAMSNYMKRLAENVADRFITGEVN